MKVKLVLIHSAAYLVCSLFHISALSAYLFFKLHKKDLDRLSMYLHQFIGKLDWQ